MKFEGYIKESRRHAGVGFIQFGDRTAAKNFLEGAEIKIRDRGVRIYISKEEAMDDEKNSKFFSNLNKRRNRNSGGNNYNYKDSRDGRDSRDG